MSSTIFYRFKSQKDTSRIQFDGTGITVFDLKRDIIHINKLGDGTDFQIRVYNPDTMEEYDDDFLVIPRSSMVILRRSPAVYGNTGNATRYVMGKPRVIMRRTTTGYEGAENYSSGIAASGTEEERIARMFANQENQWQETQDAMSVAVPVYHNRAQSGGQQIQDDGPPPPGYMCYRCGAKDHWIKNCPTNLDPNFEGKRIRRTTGIPKKFLKSVEIDPMTMTSEEMAEKKIMVTDDGKFVVQVADQHSWEDYQRKQQLQKIAVREQDAAWLPNRFEDLPGHLKCPLTGGLIREAVRTNECCKEAMSKIRMEDELLKSDFVCPLCGAKDILLDSLVPDDELNKQVSDFLKTHGGKSSGSLNAMEDSNSGLRAKDESVDESSVKKVQIPAMPMPPFGMPFMFPMPFMPPVPGSNDKKNIQNST